MPEKRVVRIVYGLGGYDPTKPNNNIIEEITTEISNEQLADEAEEKALAGIDKLIDGISNLAEAKMFLKKLCNRLIKKGLLP